MSTREVLDQIEAALRDTTVGPDAMRCNAPEPVRPVQQDTSTEIRLSFPTPVVPFVPLLAELDDGHDQ